MKATVDEETWKTLLMQLHNMGLILISENRYTGRMELAVRRIPD